MNSPVMITLTAAEAAALYVQPPYTAEEVEAAIRERAQRASFTCFDASRLSHEIQAELERQGFTVYRTGSGDAIVEWKAKAAEETDPDDYAGDEPVGWHVGGHLE